MVKGPSCEVSLLGVGGVEMGQCGKLGYGSKNPFVPAGVSVSMSRGMVAAKGMKGLFRLLYTVWLMRKPWHRSELGCWSCNSPG